MVRLTALVLLLCALIACARSTKEPTLEEAETFIGKAESELRSLNEAGQHAQWVAETYINSDTEAIVAAANERIIQSTAELIAEGKRFENLDMPAELKRKFVLLRLALTIPAPADAPPREELTRIAASMKADHGKAKYCPDLDGDCFGVEEVEERMAKVRDPKRLAEMWEGWHKNGAPLRYRYSRFVELSNQGAKELGFHDTGALWRSRYDATPEQFSSDLERLWEQLKPLYLELHAYARRRLVMKYGEAAASENGLIRADLLGNLWGREWGNIYDLVAPPETPPLSDIGRALQTRHATPRRLVGYAEDFFKSLGFGAFPESFWQLSQFVRPMDREVVCHPSAWDIDSRVDVRLKTCLHETSEDFATVYRELGRLYYFASYERQPFLFQNGANDGFPEAVGAAVALSATPEYLAKIGILPSAPGRAADLPLLLRTALDKIAFPPFALLVDRWRWEVFSGEATPDRYNAEWWRLRAKYQGVAPPVDRSESDFDPGALYEIPANIPYARNFLAAVYQFQFYRAMCKVSGYQGPLNRCSFYGSKEAGEKLHAMLALGASKPWPEALKAMTGEDRADASAMLEYFEPLSVWLKEQNSGRAIGWPVPADALKAH